MSLLACVLAVALAGRAAPPLAAARIAPPDVDALVQVRGALRGADAGSRELARGVCGMLDSIGAREAWSRAAQAAGLSPWALFDRCAGRDASLLVRRDGERAEWVLALEVPAREACDLLRAMKARMQGSARFELPQLGLAGTVAGDWLLVSDRAESPLMRDMLRLSSEAGQPTLASALPPGSFDDGGCAVSVALRHVAPASGHSVWRVATDASGVHVQVLARLDRDPFGEMREARPVGSELAVLPEDTIACWVQSMPRDPVPAAWRRSVEAWRLDERVERSLGARMIVAIGPRRDGEGTAALAVAYELRDAMEGTEAADALLDRASRACAAPFAGERRTDDLMRSRLARRHGAPIEAPRCWDAPGLVDRVFGGFDPLGSVELNARTVPLRGGGWRVYASDRDWLGEVSASLEELPSAPVTEADGPSRSCGAERVGHARGAALGELLSQWARAREGRGACCRPMQLLGAVVRHAGDVSWRLRATEAGIWQGTIDLSPPLPTSTEAVATAPGPWPK